MDNLTFFKKLAAPALVFALFFTLFTYPADRTVTQIIAPFTLVAFLHIAQKLLGKELKKLSILFDMILIGFGFSTYFNQIPGIQYYNKAAFWITVIAALIYAFYDDSSWTFGKQLRVVEYTLANTIGNLAQPAKGLKEYREKENTGKTFQILIAAVITLPILIVLCLLLSSADAIFGDLVSQTMQTINFITILKIFLKTVIAFIFWYTILKTLDEGYAGTLEDKKAPGVEALIGIIITGSVSALYLLFSVIQILGLFAGNMTLPEGYTYSQYAREGFSQLLAVCVINLIIVLVCKWCFEENRGIRLCLFIICASTYIMLASSAFRMTMYVNAYGLTRLRFSTYAGLIVIAALLTEIVISICKKTFHLYRIGLFTALLGYLALSLCQMDYWINLYNNSI